MYHFIRVSKLPTLSHSFSDIVIELAICSPGALVGDNVISSLVRLIERYSNNLGIIGLRVRDVIIAACASLGARHDILRRFNFAKADPPSIELIKEHNIVARGKPHRALCSTRYIRLMTELATWVTTSDGVRFVDSQLPQTRRSSTRRAVRCGCVLGPDCMRPIVAFRTRAASHSQPSRNLRQQY